MKHIIKDIFFLCSGKPLGNRASILSYHNVGDDKAYFTVQPAALERQLQYIGQCGFCTLSLSDLMRRIAAKEDLSNCVALTFSDGYKSFYTEVFPLLKKFNIPATMFLTVEFLDTTIKTTEGFEFDTLAPDEMREMLESGLVEFMPQTQQTVRLSEVAFESAIENIEASRKDLESITNKEAPIFAYPKGSYTDRLKEHLQNHNWIGAVTLKEGLVHSDSDPYLLPRNSVDSKTSFIQFKGKLSGTIEEYVQVRKK